MVRRVAVLDLVLLLAPACDYGDEEATKPGGGVEFGRGTALIEGDEGTVLLDVEVAQTEEQRRVGLMNRDSLPSDSGMAFIYFEPTRWGFWMKNTRIPLSVAFFDEEGKILRILDMKPCRSASCPVYSPGVSYFGALEVNRGSFEEWGVEQGDVIRITQ